MEIAEADIDEGVELDRDIGDVGEQGGGIFDRRIKQFGDALALVFDLQRFSCELGLSSGICKALFSITQMLNLRES